LNFAIGVANDHITTGGIHVTSVVEMEENATFLIDDLVPQNYSIVKEVLHKLNRKFLNHFGQLDQVTERCTVKSTSWITKSI